MIRKGYDGFTKEEEDAWTRDAGTYQEGQRIKKLEQTIESLIEKNNKLMEHIVYLKKNGYTYDQVNSKMILCDKCGKELIKEE
jgi:hypothetical protein